MADDMNAYKRHDLQPKVNQAAKKRPRLNALLILLIPALSAVLPMPYKSFAPFLLLIPLVIFLVDKFRQADEKSGNPLPNQTYSIPRQDHSVEPYFYKQKNTKDPRRYKPIE